MSRCLLMYSWPCSYPYSPLPFAFSFLWFMRMCASTCIRTSFLFHIYTHFSPYLYGYILSLFCNDPLYPISMNNTTWHAGLYLAYRWLRRWDDRRLWAVLWPNVQKGSRLHDKMCKHAFYGCANSWTHSTSVNHAIFDALLRIWSLSKRCAPYCGALDMYDTARNFYHDHHICLIMTSAMRNPACFAESA